MLSVVKQSVPDIVRHKLKQRHDQMTGIAAVAVPDGRGSGQGPLAFGMGRGEDEVHDEASLWVVCSQPVIKGPTSLSRPEI